MLILLPSFEQIKCYLSLNDQKITANIAITAIFKPSVFGRGGGVGIYSPPLNPKFLIIPEIIIRFK